MKDVFILVSIILEFRYNKGMNYSIAQTQEFNDWLSSLPAKQQALVHARLARLEEGHLGLYRVLGDGLVELKWKNGLRVYFIRTSKSSIKCLLGGSKNGQKKDIQKARGMF